MMMALRDLHIGGPFSLHSAPELCGRPLATSQANLGSDRRAPQMIALRSTLLGLAPPLPCLAWHRRRRQRHALSAREVKMKLQPALSRHSHRGTLIGLFDHVTDRSQSVFAEPLFINDSQSLTCEFCRDFWEQ
jgi:hypothetical protein